jgi:hypothetical protein
MTGIVLRCPNCGTTRATLGECEACHEAQVRYYCTNHTPGHWLDSSSCPQCGAGLGESMNNPARPAPARRPGRPGPASPRRTTTSFPGVAPGPMPTPTGRSTAGESSSGAPERLPPPDYEEFSDRSAYASRGPGLQDLLRAAAAARRRADAVPDREAAPRVEPSPGGCLGRFILIMVFLFLVLIAGLSIIGSSLFRLFFSY